MPPHRRLRGTRNQLLYHPNFVTTARALPSWSEQSFYYAPSAQFPLVREGSVPTPAGSRLAWRSCLHAAQRPLSSRVRVHALRSADTLPFAGTCQLPPGSCSLIACIRRWREKPDLLLDNRLRERR